MLSTNLKLEAELELAEINGEHKLNEALVCSNWLCEDLDISDNDLQEAGRSGHLPLPASSSFTS